MTRPKLSPKATRLLEWIERSSDGVMESQIEGSGMMKEADKLRQLGLIKTADHPTLRDRRFDTPVVVYVKREGDK